MKGQLVTLLLIASVACDRDQAVGPLDALYRRWHLIRSRPVQDTNWTVRDTNYDLEYRADNTIVYRQKEKLLQGNCCAPTGFNREGTEINYTGWVLCYNALCGTLKKATITLLSEQSLELSDGYVVSQYEAVD
ncbi:hypothetical protein [Spirosoma aerolatum]|uniref:hypothetical protein n=1 Tax=Spirosoma aerolatum TaxID=1211326 RepID=UPI0009AC1B9F|nr:hypothetical protein [Spirosoma aerolatum]